MIATPAFKQHCALVFWKGKLIFGKGNQRKKLRHIISLDDLPGDKTLNGYIKQAVALNEFNITTPRPKPKAKIKPDVPGYFLAALRKNKKALATFGNFSPSHQREYIEWITEAKREETRAKRIKTAIEWIATGKSRHWQYQ